MRQPSLFSRFLLASLSERYLEAHTPLTQDAMGIFTAMRVAPFTLLLLILLTTASNAFVTVSSRRRPSSSLFYTPHSIQASSIRFLGKGANALVRPGVVLIAPEEEYNHYLMRAAIFVYAMGMDEYDEYVIRCVVLDNPTPFTMKEMAGVGGRLHGNLLYRGGNVGGETAMMLHSVNEFGREEIGTSGIFEGGLEQAQNADSPVENFKFFFNHCQFSPNELETMLEEIDPETGDGWVSVEAPSDLVLEEWDKNDCWRFLRNVVQGRDGGSSSSS